MPARLSRLVALVAAALALLPAASALAAPAPALTGQWALDGDGPMGIASAWRQTTGGDVTVAVVDTGVDLGHPDLAPNLWTNPGEVPGNGVDDDGDGIVDDVHGADLVNGDGDPADDNGHGTHVAGIIAARGDGATGVVGVAQRARIMAVKVLDSSGGGTMDTVAGGLRYAVAHGARVVNLSLVGPAPGTELSAAIAEAQAAGVIVVAAAGNDHADDDATPVYPASFPAENLVTVTSLGRDGALAPTASYGHVAVDLAAPGEGIVSTARGGGAEMRSGTSMAAAEASGALVLLAAARPDLGWRELEGALLAGARRVALPVAAGRLDVAGALRQVVPSAQWRTAGRQAVRSAARATGGRWSRPSRRARAARARAARARAARAHRTRGRAARARVALVP